MEFRRIRDAADARECLAAIGASGQTLSAWARANVVNGRSLHAWRLILARKERAPKPPRPRKRRDRKLLRLVELVPSAPTSPSTVYAVRVGSFRVELDERFDDGVLRRLLTVVAAC